MPKKVYLVWYTTPTYHEALIGVFTSIKNASRYVRYLGEDYIKNTTLVGVTIDPEPEDTSDDRTV